MASMSLRPHARVLCALTGLAAITSSSFGAGPSAAHRIDTLDRCAFALIFATVDGADTTAAGARSLRGPTDACTLDASGATQVVVPTDIGEASGVVQAFEVLPVVEPMAVWTDSDTTAFEDAVIVAREFGGTPGAFEAITLPASVATSLLALDNLTTIVVTPN